MLASVINLKPGGKKNNFTYLMTTSSSMMWLVGCLFGFYGISTLVGHLTPNSVYIYIHIQPMMSK